MEIHQASDLQEELTALRRHFHEHPEKSWEEYQTQKKIMEYLTGLGIPCIKTARSGVIASIGEDSSAPVIGLRADIDALPIQEQNDVPYCSQNAGVMHACGHDTHIAMLLGAARLLKEREAELKLRVCLVFQPAEEYIADSGAFYMKDEPLIQECERLIAIHIWSKIPCGYASLRYGPVMAAADTFDIDIQGKGGHGALPHQTIDPITTGAELVSAIQRMVAREISPLDPAVISVTAFRSGTTSNVIPDSAHLMGTARTFNNEQRARYPEMLRRVAEGVGTSTGAKITLDYHYGTPAMINEDGCVDTGRRVCEQIFGKEHLLDWELQMGGEDFAKYQMPKCILLLGGGFPEEERRYPQHSPFFDVDERALVLGAEYFLRYVEEYQKERGRA